MQIKIHVLLMQAWIFYGSLTLENLMQNTYTLPTSKPNTIIKCPHCQSTYIESRNIAKKAGRRIGAVAGGAAGATGMMGGAEAGATVGLSGGPAGVVIGGLLGAIIGGFIGAATGSKLGENVGEVVDERFLENYRCLNCNHTFD